MKYLLIAYSFLNNIFMTLFIMFPQLMLLFINSTIIGTILCLLYPHIHILFPLAYEQGILPLRLGWWDSVCISWMFGALFKTTNTINNKNGNGQIS